MAMRWGGLKWGCQRSKNKGGKKKFNISLPKFSDADFFLLLCTIIY